MLLRRLQSPTLKSKLTSSRATSKSVLQADLIARISIRCLRLLVLLWLRCIRWRRLCLCVGACKETIDGRSRSRADTDESVRRLSSAEQLNLIPPTTRH
jgi:hypothetical protein